MFLCFFYSQPANCGRHLRLRVSWHGDGGGRMGAMSPTSTHKHLHARAHEHAPTHVKARSGTNKNPTDSSKPSETACFKTFPHVRNLICDDWRPQKFMCAHVTWDVSRPGYDHQRRTDNPGRNIITKIVAFASPLTPPSNVELGES